MWLVWARTIIYMHICSYCICFCSFQCNQYCREVNHGFHILMVGILLLRSGPTYPRRRPLLFQLHPTFRSVLLRSSTGMVKYIHWRMSQDFPGELSKLYKHMGRLWKQGVGIPTPWWKLWRIRGSRSSSDDDVVRVKLLHCVSNAPVRAQRSSLALIHSNGLGAHSHPTIQTHLGWYGYLNVHLCE